MLNDLGYYRPTFDELLTKQEERAKILFGDDIDISGQSVLGKFIRLCVDDYADIYEDLEQIYYSRFPNSASGTALDRLCPFAGLTRNPATYAQHKIEVNGEPGAVIESGFLVCSSEGVEFRSLEDYVVGGEGKACIIVEAENSGTSGNVSGITSIVNPVEKIDSIFYVEPVYLAENLESDYALRTRFKKTISGTGSGTVDSIIGAVQRVKGVTGVNLVENDTYETDSHGRPPKSFEVYALAPPEQDYAIAEAIFSKKPVGIFCVGDIEVEVKDAGGLPHKVRFSKTIEVKIYLKVTIRTDSFFEHDGSDRVKEYLSDYVSTLENGQDVVMSSLYGHIHKVTGVAEVNNLLLSTDNETFTPQNIPCGAYEKATLHPNDISIEVSGHE